MVRFTRERIRLLAIAVVSLGFAGGLGALIFAWSGAYSVAASSGHFKFIEWFLHFGMQQSVDTHSIGIKAPPLDNPDLVTLGAGHFHAGCAYCHGAPGVAISPIAKHMLPPPPDLFSTEGQWEDRELFWIIKHGLKYTGMPGWSTQQRDDEVWAMVAFLRKMPNLDREQYRDLAIGNLPMREQSGREIAMSESSIEAVGACGRCHGYETTRPRSNLTPVLHGQPVEFLAAALKAFTDGKRHSGIMQPVAVDLLPDAIQRVSSYYAGLAPLPVQPSKASAASIERGRLLATQGDAAGKVPACASCHDETALKVYPRLAGQSAAYMANRLRLWKNNINAATDSDAIMAPIARMLTEQQMDDAANYFASQPRTRGGGTASR